MVEAEESLLMSLRLPELPPMTRIRQKFEMPTIQDPAAEVRKQLDATGVRFAQGERIAVALGSRGIANLAAMAGELIRWLKEQGAEPFIFPAMGSHGGANAEGQKQVLEKYGVTEAAMGVPIRSSMETVKLPSLEDGTPVFQDKHAAGADGIVLLNRIKPHTDYHAEYESGLAKMLVIGMGKQDGAMAIHHLGLPGVMEVLPRVAKQILAHSKVRLAVGIIENARDETSLIRAVKADEIMAREPALLDEAKRRMPRLPVRDIDILVVDRLGKDISGVGMDPNVIGRMYVATMPEPDYPRVTMLIVRDISEKGYGNAMGVGLADVTTRRLVDRINYSAMYENLFTAGLLERGKIPIIAETDHEAFGYAFRGCGPLEPQDARIIRMQDTLHVTELHASPSLVTEMQDDPRIEVLGPVGELFEADGSLRDF
jgi:hypothetical protein